MNHIVSAWGDNSNGQLGNGSTTGHYAPVAVAGLEGVRKVEAGSGHIIALLEDGTAYGWGRNAFGQIGDGSTGNADVPSQVKLDGIKDIAPGGGHTLLLRDDGTVWGCGAGFFGMLGPDNMRVHPVPVPIEAPDGIVQLVSGGSQGLALLSDGTVWSWGRDDVGQLGDGEEHGKRPGTVIQAHAGREYPCRPVALQVLGLNDATWVAAGGGHSLAVLADGSLYGWGSNDRGQLGDGATIHRFSPVKANVTGVRAAAGAYHHTVALLQDGSLRAFGINDKGQLGNGTTENSAAPVEVAGLRDVVQVVATGGGGDDNPGGHGHNLALLADGSVWGWGCNGHGELGIGDTEDRLTPVRLDLPGVTHLTVGGEVPGFRENPGGGYALAVHPAS
jgi:alpha-tubulin suppressor-like RCC1 family protein